MLLPEVILQQGLETWKTGRPTHEHNVMNILSFNFSINEHLSDGREALIKDLSAFSIENLTRNRNVEIFAISNLFQTDLDLPGV